METPGLLPLQSACLLFVAICRWQLLCVPPCSKSPGHLCRGQFESFGQLWHQVINEQKKEDWRKDSTLWDSMPAKCLHHTQSVLRIKLLVTSCFQPLLQAGNSACSTSNRRAEWISHAASPQQVLHSAFSWQVYLAAKGPITLSTWAASVLPNCKTGGEGKNFQQLWKQMRSYKVCMSKCWNRQKRNNIPQFFMNLFCVSKAKK